MAKENKTDGMPWKPTFLAAWRTHRKISQEVAGKCIGVDPSIVSKIERGKAAYQPYQLDRLADLYGCKRGDLLDTDPAMVADEEARLRGALLAYGVDRSYLQQVIDIIDGFEKVSKSEEIHRADGSQSASPRREEEPLE